MCLSRLLSPARCIPWLHKAARSDDAPVTASDATSMHGMAARDTLLGVHNQTGGSDALTDASSSAAASSTNTSLISTVADTIANAGLLSTVADTATSAANATLSTLTETVSSAADETGLSTDLNTAETAQQAMSLQHAGSQEV